MVTVFSTFPLRPGLDRGTAVAEIHETLGWCKQREGVVRTYRQ